MLVYLFHNSSLGFDVTAVSVWDLTGARGAVEMHCRFGIRQCLHP